MSLECPTRIVFNKPTSWSDRIDLIDYVSEENIVAATGDP